MELSKEVLKASEDLKGYLLGLNGASLVDEDTISFNGESKKGTIIFYLPYVELNITLDGENIFLLQTELVSKTQIDEYLKSFFGCLYDKQDNENNLENIKGEHNILFVCSCGVISSILAEKCQKKIDELNINAHFKSCSVDRLDNEQDKYERIYFLPQISYLLRRENFKNKNKIKVLPTTYVALSDIDSILSYTLNPRL